MRRRITITDVAEHAGVSRTTVSLVLADEARISADTKARVRAAMAELGYVYNRVAEAVRSGRSSLVGLVLTDIRNPFYADFTMGVADAVAGRRTAMLQGFSQADPVREAQIVRSLIEYQVAGLLLVATDDATAASLGLADGGPDVVQIFREVAGLDADFVGIDNIASGRILGDHLRAVGVHSVVLVGGDPAARLPRERGEGILRGLGMRSTLQRVPDADALRQVLADGRPPNCVVTYNNSYLLAVMHALRDAGLEPGKSIAVASFDNTDLTADVWPGITVVDHHPVQMGRAATDLLFDKWDHPDRPAERVMVPGSLVVRESTARH